MRSSLIAVLLTSFDLPCFAFTATESWMTSFETVQAANGQLKSAELIEIQWVPSVSQQNHYDFENEVNSICYFVQNLNEVISLKNDLLYY